MRLINVRTGKLEEHGVPPPYAILSHTWRKSEISFQDMTGCADVQSKPEYDKIRDSSREALRYKLDFIWIDSCCIDKSSSAELSEAINSMFRLYKDAVLCFAYLEDLPIGRGAATESELEKCRWFTRGWTLQELIAPKEVRFFDGGWNDRGTKQTLQDALSRITAIKTDVLLGRHLNRLGSIPVAERMSWASRRETTRHEDMAYCLLGIFGVNMALIYGEGVNAFTRLQEEIIQRTNDLSILAWDSRGRSRSGPYCGVLAESPAEFAQVPRGFSASSRTMMTEFTVTNRGLRISTELWVPSDPASFGRGYGYFLCLSDARVLPFVGIQLKKVGRSHFVRISDKLLTAYYLNFDSMDMNESMRLQTIYLATSHPIEMALDTLEERSTFHFPVHPVFTVTNVAPRAGWDIFDRLFHTGGTGFSSSFGVVCISVSDIGDGAREPVKLGLLTEAWGDGPKCSLFKWEGSVQQQMELVFKNDSEFIFSDVLLQTLSAVRLHPHVDFRFRSEDYRISISIQREVVKEISPVPLHSVRIQRFRRSANGEDWVSLD